MWNLEAINKRSSDLIEKVMNPGFKSYWTLLKSYMNSNVRTIRDPLVS